METEPTQFHSTDSDQLIDFRRKKNIHIDE